MENFRDKGFLSNIIPIPPETHRGYSLRSGSVVNSSVKVVARTERMNNFHLFWLLRAKKIMSFMLTLSKNDNHSCYGHSFV